MTHAYERAVRPGHDNDSWELIALISACWSEYPGCVMDVHGECPDLLAPATVAEREGGAFWVATDPCGTVVATVGWRPLRPGTIELKRLYVARRCRREGLASRLMDLAEAEAVGAGATSMELWTDTRFIGAHVFYKGRGYTIAGPDRELRDLSRTREHHFEKHLAGRG